MSIGAKRLKVKSTIQSVKHIVPEQHIEISNKIIQGCIRGKTKYQEMLYKQYYSFGMSICLRYGHNRDEAAEILNDSFMKVFENLEKFDIQYSFKAWFRRIIINTAIDYFRKNLKHYNHLDVEVIDRELADISMISELDINDVIMLLNQLPENLKITFNLYEIEGYSHQEIAQFLGIAEGTSRSNLTRARNILKKTFSTFYKRTYAEVV